MNWFSNARCPVGPVRRAGLYLATVFVLLAGMAASANATTRNVPGSYADIQTAINASVPFDIVLVAPGTYVIGTTINANVADVTIQGSGIGTTTLQVASPVGKLMLILASGVTVRDFTIEKTDLPGAPHELIGIQAANVTIRDNEIYGPDPGTAWSVNGIVSRAMVVSGGSNGLNIHDNTIHHLRQPCYITGPTTGTITNNVVYGTRGWVIEGGALTFSGNSWSTGGNQGADIALLPSANPLDYPNLLALSTANSDAYISAQFVGGENGRAIGYVDDSAAPGGVGMSTNRYQTITDGMAGTLTGGTVSVAAGTYAGGFTLNRRLLVRGSQTGVAACGRVVGAPSPATESIISGGVGAQITLATGCANGAIDGFSIIGGTKGIESTSGPLTNLQISNNHIAGFTVSGTFLNDSGDDITLNQNNLDGTSAGGGGLMHFDQDQFKGLWVTSNCVKNGASGTGIFVDGNHNINPSVGRTPLIDGNLVQANGTGANLGRFAFTGGTISNNTFTGNTFDGLQGGIQNTAITANIFSSNLRSGLALTGFGGAGDPTRGAQNCTLTLNNFVANGREGLFYTSGQFPGTVSTNVAHNNNFVGNGTLGSFDGVAYAGVETLNLTCNWWNSANGPDFPPTNPNPPGDDLAATNALFVQWLVGPAPGGACLGGDDVSPGPAPSCISTAHPCITIPVSINRVNATPMRGFSVTLSLSPELMLCSGTASITEGPYLNGVSGTNFQVLDNGGGSYTVDCAILGLPCGATGDGTLFNLAVKNSGGDGTGTISVTSVTARDCLNAPVPASPGAVLAVTIDNTLPVAVVNLAATQKKTGNDGDGTTKIQLTFTPPVDASIVEVYRKGFGVYPEYDDNGGTVPPTPGAYPPAGWTLTAVTASGQYDEVSAPRDFWYYVIFTKDGCGNVSPVSNRTGGTLNYHLGDVTDGFTAGQGNNLVNTADISLLGAHYGITLALNDTYNYLDVGPTTDFSVNARPTTDNRVQFEDLIMFAINYGLVSKPAHGGPVEAATADALRLDVPAVPEVGNTFVASVNLSSAGRIQGVSLNLEYDRTVVEPVAVEAGELMGRQGSEGLVLSSGPGNVDAAVLGTGATISGSGELARVTFRVLGQGDARVALGSADARDSRNEKVSLNVAGGVTGGVKPVVATFLGANYPNPFHGSTQIPLGLKTAGLTKLAVFDVAGRLVKTLIDGPMEAGQRVVEWDGRDDGGRSVASGFYVIRLTAPDDVRTRSVKIVR